MIKTSEAKQLCTKTEFDLFSDSQSRSVKALSEAELRKRIQRSRTARDKYRSLAQRQRREARGKQQPRGRRPSKSAQRTARKTQLFSETLTRYQKRLTEVRGQASRISAKKKVAQKTPKKAAKKKSMAKAKAVKPRKKSQTTKVAKAKKEPATTKATRTKAAKLKTKAATTEKAAQRKQSATETMSKVKTAQKKKTPAAKTKSAALIRQRQAGSGIIRKQKHTSARGKKNQARRDSKSR